MLAKLENGVLIPAPEKRYLGQSLVYNPTEEVLLEAGYLPVQYAARPEVDEGYYAVPGWVQEKAVIVQRWSVKKDVRPMSQEAVSRMLLAREINTLPMDTTMTLRCREFFPAWAPGAYTVGYTVQHGGNLWKCLQEHDSTGNPDWCPGKAASLWGAWHALDAPLALPWVAPTGAHDAYQAGEFMAWTDGAIYKCLADATVWGPDVVPGAWEVQE